MSAAKGDIIRPIMGPFIPEVVGQSGPEFSEPEVCPAGRDRFKNPNQVGSPQGPDRAGSGSHQGPMTRMGPSISVLEVVLSVYLGGREKTGPFRGQNLNHRSRFLESTRSIRSDGRG